MSASPSTSEISAMEAVINDVNSAWTKANPHKFVAAAPAVAAHQFLVKSLMQWQAGDTSLIATSVDFIPVVTIEGMPTNRYPEYIPILTAATVACMRAESPHMSIALAGPTFQKIVALAVASRAGFWAAMNWAPKCTSFLPPRALAYDRKRRDLWLAGTSGDHTHDTWLALFAQTAPDVKGYIRELHHVAIVSPMCGVMGASVQTALGSVYAFDLMMEKVLAVVNRRISGDLSIITGLTAAELTELLTSAPLTGAPVSAARVWASDPLVAVGAQRRIAVTRSEVRDAEKREARFSSGRETPASLPSYDDVAQSEFADPMLKLAAAAKSMADVPPSAPTILHESGAQSLASGAATPRPAAGPASVSTHEEEMAEADRVFIQEVARHAQQSAPPVPSMLNGANDDESAVW